MDSIVILLATLNRPDWLKRVICSIRETTPTDTPIMVATDPDDSQARAIAETLEAWHCTCAENRRGPAYAWNTALAAVPHKNIYVIAADDLIFMAGWYEKSLAALSDELNGSGLVGFNDTRKDGNLKTSTHYLMTRDFIIQHHGGVAAVPHYRTCGVDFEACARARRANKYHWCKDAIVKHDWRGNDQDADKTYRQARPLWMNDEKMLVKRGTAGWPDDFEAVIK